MISYLAGKEEIKARSVDSMSSLEAMAVQRRAEAALLEAGFPMGYLSVSVPEPGRVNVVGSVTKESDITRAENILRGVKGVESIENSLWVMSPRAERNYPV